MAVERASVSLDVDLAAAVRQAADHDGLSPAAWMADAVRRQLAARGLKQVVRGWETEHEAFTRTELDQPRQRLTQ